MTALMVFSCSRPADMPLGSETLAHVNDKTITRDEVVSQIPKGLSAADSLLRAENIIHNRIIDLLMDDVAYQNIGDDKAEIERLVNDYRLSLIRHRYQERIVRDKMSEEISERDLHAYYDENKEIFSLDDNIIRGVFLKLPANAPNLNEVRKLYRSNDPDDMEKVEKYSLQNAVIYDFFYDHWLNFNEVLAKIPTKLANPSLFLRYNNNLEASDSSFVYLLNIAEKLTVGSPAPFEYVKEQINNLLSNKRKIEYIHKFKEELYRDAVKNRKVTFTND
jgi:hypothetical protein